MNTKPEKNTSAPNATSIEGMEQLLDQAHLELLDSNEESLESSSAYVDMRMTLELLDQVQNVRDLLRETNTRLTRAYSRVRHLESVVDKQEKSLEGMPGLQKLADRALELQDKLDEAISEIEKLQQPWWRKLTPGEKE